MARMNGEMSTLRPRLQGTIFHFHVSESECVIYKCLWDVVRQCTTPPSSKDAEAGDGASFSLISSSYFCDMLRPFFLLPHLSCSPC